MSQVTSRVSVTYLGSNDGFLGGEFPTHLHAERGDRRRKFLAAQEHHLVRFYVSDDDESDVRLCIHSWEYRHSITINGRTSVGEIKCFSGTVEGVARALDLAAGEFWLVTMRELEPMVEFDAS